jgi:hypothetical protein
MNFSQPSIISFGLAMKVSVALIGDLPSPRVHWPS